MARLSGTENPKFEDTETTVPGAQGPHRQDPGVRAQSVPEASFAGGEDRDIDHQGR